MITFETQEDFEQAVVDIIKTRLKLGVSYGREPDIYLSIVDSYYSDICNLPEDDKFSCTELPTPSLRY